MRDIDREGKAKEEGNWLEGWLCEFSWGSF